MLDGILYIPKLQTQKEEKKLEINSSVSYSSYFRTQRKCAAILKTNSLPLVCMFSNFIEMNEKNNGVDFVHASAHFTVSLIYPKQPKQ